MAQKRDYYEVLGVSRTADPKEIKSSYRKLAMKYHPDRNQGDEDAEARFKEAAEAYEVLSDEQKRQLYDRGGFDGLKNSGFAGGNADLGDIFSQFGDIFSDLFGGGFGGGFGFGGGARGPGLSRYRGPRSGPQRVRSAASQVRSESGPQREQVELAHPPRVGGGAGERAPGVDAALGQLDLHVGTGHPHPPAARGGVGGSMRL